MSHPLYVAFIWHQHQPLYKSRAASSADSEQYRLPWVRLHGTKDYLDLVLLLEKYPKLHQTVNLVPSLILQLEDYAEGKALDPYLKLLLTPTDQLDLKGKHFVLERFFDANHHTLIDPHPRYRELFEERHEKGIAWCLDNWQERDYGDLLAWHNLAWIDPLFWDDPDIAGWLKKGRDFSLSDRQRILSKQKEIISRIVPQHRKMQEAGQLEVTTTPYTHPILPLLADTNSGRVAVPEMELPKNRFLWKEDIPRHLHKAWKLYCDRFGREPRGLWPSEQSVSPEILYDVAKQGFNWLCSDEAVLGWTKKHFFHRDSNGNVFEPELLYRPYRLKTDAGDLAIVFRDHRLSDLIGFTYGSMAPKEAAADLVGHLEAIGRSLKHRQEGDGLERPWLVTIALDGENCWEFYKEDGKPFLESLYQILSHHHGIELVTVSDFIDRFPPTETLPSDRLHSGSWVDGSFTTWIGDPIKNKAWDMLTRARQTLANHPEATEENNPEAWEALYAAEGSDWFWWFGEGHSSEQDAIFDRLFREHLGALYHALNEPIPDDVRYPLEAHEKKGDMRPQSFIHPVIDGVGDEQDWDHAGRIDVGGSRGTMHRSSPVQRLWYGLDHLNFYLRLDFKRGVEPGKDCPSELHLLWYYPQRPMYTSPAPLRDLPDAPPLNYRFATHLEVNLISQSYQMNQSIEHDGWRTSKSRVKVAVNKCLEIAVPWVDLPTEPDWNLHLVAVLAEDERFQDYIPENGLIPMVMP
ncbi:glycoside hydrolase [Baaleninema sp.]|uniref:glycoside hydrolase n=1 Tax=Baaleninema sp. TaxID=3101197 RepID=UPI003D04BF36